MILEDTEQFNQPKDKSQHILITPRGSKPRSLSGRGQRRLVRKKCTFTVPANTNHYYIDTSAQDDANLTSQILMEKEVGSDSPFLFTPYLYSVVFRANINPKTNAAITLGAITAYIQDTKNNNPVYADTPPLQGTDVYISNLGTILSIPQLRYDDYDYVDSGLVYFRNLELRIAAVISNATGQPLPIDIFQFLHFETEDLTDNEN